MLLDGAGRGPWPRRIPAPARAYHRDRSHRQSRRRLRDHENRARLRGPGAEYRREHVSRRGIGGQRWLSAVEGLEGDANRNEGTIGAVTRSVILSVAKDPKLRNLRSFASLRMTAALHCVVTTTHVRRLRHHQS